MSGGDANGALLGVFRTILIALLSQTVDDNAVWRQTRVIWRRARAQRQKAAAIALRHTTSVGGNRWTARARVRVLREYEPR